MTERGDEQYKTIRKSGNSRPLSVTLTGDSSPQGEPFLANTASGNLAFYLTLTITTTYLTLKSARYKTASGNLAFNKLA